MNYQGAYSGNNLIASHHGVLEIYKLGCWAQSQPKLGEPKFLNKKCCKHTVCLQEILIRQNPQLILLINEVGI